MSAIDLIILGILKQESCGAYEIQKALEYRKISKWVKVSSPSIYKKVLQLETKGMIAGKTEKSGKMPEKVVYSLTQSGEAYFNELMLSLSDMPITLMLDFNAVIVNLDKVSEETQEQCINAICKNIMDLRMNLRKMLEQRKHIPHNGQIVLQQQLGLAEVLEQWADELKNGQHNAIDDF